ncbi:MAG: metallophosphoesterase [Clostridiaceae bacterium]|nr:metallophosphoesterase [Clostridiaceae bacterium]
MTFLTEQPVFLTALIVLLLIIFQLYQNNRLKVSRYIIESSKIPSGMDGFTLCHLSDLHSKRFGKDNRRLLEKIDEIQPDIVVITGDMMNNRNDDGRVFLDLLPHLTKYRCYYVTGNHEQFTAYWDPAFMPKYLEKIRNAGVVVLNNEKLVIKKGSEQIRLYGLQTDLKYYRNMRDTKFSKVEFTEKNLTDLLGECSDRCFNLLLTHNPLHFQAYADWGADLVLCGHVHGGVIRLPGVGGLLSPERVFFPEYSEGIYTKNNTRMIVSRGLGNSTINLRVFNRPEIVVAELKRTSIG